MQNSDSADFTVRIRFRIPSRDHLSSDKEEVALNPADGRQVTLKSADTKKKTIRNADWLVLQSGGWHSEEDAENAAMPLMEALQRALAYLGIAADLGRRSSDEHLYRAGREWLEGTIGRPTVQDVHGAMVFATELCPVFARIGSAHGSRIIQDERWMQSFLFALGCDEPLSERERIAFDLFSAAGSVSDCPEARFVLLFAAIEALLEEIPRPEEAINHVNSLMECTSTADIDEDEKKEIRDALKWLRSKSIGWKGRRLVRERLSDRRYDDRSAEDFFSACYKIRNGLLHGRRFPSRQEVNQLVGGLNQMVGHLLAGPVLDIDEAT